MKKGIDKDEKTDILRLVPRNVQRIELIDPKLNKEAMILEEENLEIEKKNSSFYIIFKI